MSAYPPRNCASDRGAALLIVLALVVLLTGLVVAYFSRTTTDRQLAKADSEGTSVDLLARSALDIVVSGFKQEIANGTPITSTNVVPQRSPIPAAGATPIIPNLIRRSAFGDAIAAPPAVPSAASDINSTISSINGRSISLERWNTHYMVPKLNTGDDGADPITGGPIFTAPNYWAPDWVVVTRGGPVVFTGWDSALKDRSPTNGAYALGRYAYAVYDEGGLLDANLVGLPSPTPATIDVGRKGNIAFADLTAMRLTPTGSTANPTTISKLVAWRNYATLQSSGTFANLSPTPNPSPKFLDYFLDTSRDFQTVAATVYNNRTDQAFISRRELIELFRGSGVAGSIGIGGSFNMLQFLGTFSRELNRPTWVGTPSVQLNARFPLSRFNLFATTPPSSANSKLIQDHFGLAYVPGSGPAAPEHWQYNGITGAIRQGIIPSLTAANQDPDLITLLKYAIPSSSDAEILSIAASLIDQRDTDPNTTWIEFGDPSSPVQKAFGVDSTPPINPTDPRPASAPVLLKRAFRNVGELGYAYRNGSSKLDFHTATSVDAPLLDLFTYNTAPVRSGVVNLNTQNSPVIAAIVAGALPTEASASGVTVPQATPAAVQIIKATAGQPAIGRRDVARLAAAPVNSPFTLGNQERETVARALAEVTQTRTWGLLIDVIAQTGRYPASAANLSQFVVESEKRYWLHIAIDRFTGQVIAQQLEAVNE